MPDIVLRGCVIPDGDGGAIIDLSFGIAIVDAVRKFNLSAQDFAPCDLAVELLFLQEAKSSAISASFSLNARLNGEKLAAESDAVTDELTGLGNRRALDNAMSRLGRSNTAYAMLHLDLDRFKQVNDTLGHDVGDALLKHAARVMRRVLRKEDVVARMGGDEFVIVCPGLVDRARLDQLARQIIGDLSASVDPPLAKVPIGASIGIAMARSDRKLAPDHALKRADIALYAAKRSGRGCHRFWQPELGETLCDMAPGE
nr:GGDEF domain-containing protein [Marivita sp. GX14005]